MSILSTRAKGSALRLLGAAGLLLVASGTAQATDVGVSISIGQPGFYGTVDIGDYPRPQVIYAEPRIIRRERVVPAPVYLRVPPGHAKDWDKHCDHYNACSRPVYFVQDRWYEDVYVPAYRTRHSDGGGSNRYYDDNHQGNDDDQGNGHGNGKGKGKGHNK